MDPATLSNLIIQYRYWVLIPLSILEGPIIAFIAGTLASLGFFNIYALGAFFFARDMIMDMLYYSLGYFGGRTALARFLLRKIGVHEGHLEHVRELWNKHAGKTMFLGKLSYGIASSFIAVAGMVKMRLTNFMAWGALVAISQYGVLLLLGYFYGATFTASLTHLIENIQYLIVGASVVAVIYYFVSAYMRKELLEESKD